MQYYYIGLLFSCFLHYTSYSQEVSNRERTVFVEKRHAFFDDTVIMKTLTNIDTTHIVHSEIYKDMKALICDTSNEVQNYKYITRALLSGKDKPQRVIIDTGTVFYKIVSCKKQDSVVKSSKSYYFISKETYEEITKDPTTIEDKISLPIQETSVVYKIYEVKAKKPTCGFSSIIAGTEQYRKNDQQITYYTCGGFEQILLVNICDIEIWGELELRDYLTPVKLPEYENCVNSQ